MNDAIVRKLESIQESLAKSMHQSRELAKGKPNADSIVTVGDKLAYKVAYEQCVKLLNDLAENSTCKVDDSIDAFKDLYGIR